MERIIKQPYSSVQQRDYFVSAQMGQMDRANKLHPSTPDLVHSLNALNNSISLPAIRDAHQGTHGSKRRGACLRPCVCRPSVPRLWGVYWIIWQWICGRTRELPRHACQFQLLSVSM